MPGIGLFGGNGSGSGGVPPNLPEAITQALASASQANAGVLTQAEIDWITADTCWAWNQPWAIPFASPYYPTKAPALDFFGRGYSSPLWEPTSEEFPGLLGLWSAYRNDLLVLNGQQIARIFASNAGGSSMAQTTASLQPFYSQTGFFGRPCIASPGGRWMRSLFACPADNFALAIVKPDAITASVYVFSTTEGGRGVVQLGSGFRYALYNGSELSSGVVADVNTPVVVGAVFRNSPGLCEIKVNGGSVTANVGTSTNYNSMNLFANYTGAVTLTGKIMAALKIDGVPASQDIEKIEGWAAWMMQGNGDSLPIAHPYKAEPPLQTIIGIQPSNYLGV